MSIGTAGVVNDTAETKSVFFRVHHRLLAIPVNSEANGAATVGQPPDRSVFGKVRWIIGGNPNVGLVSTSVARCTCCDIFDTLGICGKNVVAGFGGVEAESWKVSNDQIHNYLNSVSMQF